MYAVIATGGKQYRVSEGTVVRVEKLDADAGAYSCEGPPANFIDLVSGKTSENLSPGEAAMRSVTLLDAAYRSAGSGRVEPCD